MAALPWHQWLTSEPPVQGAGLISGQGTGSHMPQLISHTTTEDPACHLEDQCRHMNTYILKNMKSILAEMSMWGLLKLQGEENIPVEDHEGIEAKAIRLWGHMLGFKSQLCLLLAG